MGITAEGETIMNTLISAENTWMLMAVMFGSVALTIFLEQKYVWGSRISGAVIVLIIAVCLTNFPCSDLLLRRLRRGADGACAGLSVRSEEDHA